MEVSPMPKTELSRLSALADCQILDTAAEEIFDSITSLASQICDVPISLIVFIDKNRQWFKSTYGIPEELKDIKETPRDVAFCAHTILESKLLEVNDLTHDARFSKNPFVTDFPNIRYYAGVPLAISENMNIGTLCVLDQKPRELTQAQKKSLEDLSKIIVALLKAKKELAEITMLGQVLQTSFNEIYLFDVKTLKCLYANECALENAQLQQAKIPEYFLYDIFLIFSKENSLDILAPLLSKNKKFILIQSTCKRQNNSEYPSELRIQLSLEKATPILIIAANDITQRKIFEEELKNSNSMLEQRIQDRTLELSKSFSLIKATLQATSDAIVVVNNNNKLMEYNQKYIDFFGNLSNHQDEDFLKFLKSQLISSEIFSTRIEEIQRYPHQKTFDELFFKNGRIFEFNSQPQIINNEIMGRVWCLRDVTTQRNLQTQLVQQATHDSLTDIPNRVLLEDRIKQAIIYSKNSNLMFAVLFIDIDRFKKVNDFFGHETGDKLLKMVANRIKNHIRSTDSLGRMGGDEFVAVITSLKNENEIGLFCQNLQKAIAEDYLIDGNSIKISSSLGISLYPKDSEDIAALLRNADIAMFRAKESRNNAFHFYTEGMNIRAAERLELENYLSHAIDNNELLLNYQPLINVATRNIFGVEALLRWHHPKLGLVPPLEFIPIAETTGVILPVGDWVLRTACRQLKEWHDNGFPQLRMAVNVSAYQFKQQNFLTILKSALEDSRVDPKFLDLELTESLMLDDVDTIIEKMNQINSLGVSLVIDDFGTGYSSLNYLKKLPIKKLKIDRSFVQSINSDSRDVAIILAIIAMAKSLNITVLAEGVEREDQLYFLINNHCQELQGYLFSRPLGAEKCYDFFKQYLKDGMLLNSILLEIDKKSLT